MKIAVAYIKKPRGYKGELAAVLYRPSSRSLRPGLQITLEKANDRQDFEIENVKFLHGRIGVKLMGIDDEETASAWSGAEVLIEKEKLEPLQDDEFYHFQIEGAKVYDQNGAYVGAVAELVTAPGNDLMIIEAGDDRIMIPFVKAIVKSVDTENGKIVIDMMDGLY